MWFSYLVTSATAASIALAPASHPRAGEASPLLKPVRYELDLTIDLGKAQLSGTARITVRNPHREPVSEASFLLYRLMRVSAIRGANDRAIPFTQTVVAFEDFGKMQVNHVRVPLAHPLGPNDTTTVAIDYGGYLLGYAETGMLYVKDRIDSTYTLVRMDANAYPLVGSMNRSVNRANGLPEYDYLARITVPATYTVANGGALVDKREHGAWATFTYRNLKPAWRMDFGVARFGVLQHGDLRIYYLPADSSGAVRIMDAMTRTMALYTRWWGALHGPAQFAIIEIPDGWGSQADVTSILQAAAAFSNPKREVEFYHELSHLWNVRSTEPTPPRWNEGLAMFMQDLTTDTLSGASTSSDGAEATAKRLRLRLHDDSALHSVPPVDYGKRDMTGYSYSVGALMFYALHRIVGQESFNRIIGGYYAHHESIGATTDDFVKFAQANANADLTPFFRDWMYTAKWSEYLFADSTFAATLARYGVRAEQAAPSKPTESDKATLEYLPVGLFIASIEEGARIFTPVRLLPREHPEALGHDFPTVQQFHRGESELLIALGRKAGLSLGTTLQRYPTEPDGSWPYALFAPPPSAAFDSAAVRFLPVEQRPIPGLRALAIMDGAPIAFIVDTRGLTLAERGMSRATSSGLDVSRAQLMNALGETSKAGPPHGPWMLVYGQGPR